MILFETAYVFTVTAASVKKWLFKVLLYTSTLDEYAVKNKISLKISYPQVLNSGPRQTGKYILEYVFDFAKILYFSQAERFDSTVGIYSRTPLVNEYTGLS